MAQIASIPGTVGKDLPKPVMMASLAPGEQLIAEFAALLSRAQSGDLLSRLLADLLTLAIRNGDKDLRAFCERELAGYPSGSPLPHYRMPKMFVSLEDLNPQYLGWGGRVANVLQYMRANPQHFPQLPVGMTQPLSDFESRSTTVNTLGIMIQKVRDFPVPTSLDPETQVFLYSAPDLYQTILKGARQELTQRLLDKLRVLAPV